MTLSRSNRINTLRPLIVLISALQRNRRTAKDIVDAVELRLGHR